MQKITSIPLILFGTGGASKEVYYLIEQINKVSQDEKYEILGCIEEDEKKVGELAFSKINVIATDENVQSLISNYEQVAIVIPIGDPKIKKKIFEKIDSYNCENILYPNLIHPNAIVDSTLVKMDQGNIISAGVVMACDIELGNFNLINRSCTIGHDVSIGNFNTLNPMATISGDVHIGNDNLIGAGAIVLQGISIGDNITVGAGAVVTKDVEESVTVVGIPATQLIKEV